VSSLTDCDLSEAIPLYLGFGFASSASSGRSRLVARFGERRAAELEDAITQLVRETHAIEIDWEKHSLASAGKFVRDERAVRHPALSDKALNALVWKFTWDWR
jgi:hypothetical protein